MGDEILIYTAGDGDDGQRLDKVLANGFADLSRSRLKALILEGAVRVDGAIHTDPSLKIRAGYVLHVAVPPPVEDRPAAENIPLDVIFEDEAMLVINKPAGLVVHPGAGNHSGTLVNALLHHCGDSLSGIGGVKRPGIVHRLDKDTSGLMVAAKSDKAHQDLSAQLSDRTLSRHYKAVIWGVPQLSKGAVDQPIGRHPANRVKMAINSKNGREAKTFYEIEEKYGKTACLADCKLESGRTHQIRVHMAYIKHPLIGDPLYGLQANAGVSALKKGGYGEKEAESVLSFPRQALHAWKIGFVHPLTRVPMGFEIVMPDDMASLIKCLKSTA